MQPCILHIQIPYFLFDSDNLRRSDATVFTVGVGREVVYDMTTVIDRKKSQEVSMIRSCNPEGTIIVLDEEA